MNKVSESFKKTIKAHLDAIAGIDDEFALFYENCGDKTIEECCEYILSEAKKNGCSGYDDKEVYGWAIHYYEEKDLKFEKVQCQKVVVNHHVDLTEEEKEELKKQAKEDFIRECKDKMKSNSITSKKPVVEKKEEEKVELVLF